MEMFQISCQNVRNAADRVLIANCVILIFHLPFHFNELFLNNNLLYITYFLFLGDLSSKNDTKGHKNVSKESNYKRGDIIIIPQNV